MNGHISVNSTPGKGSCFGFEILLKRSQKSRPIKPDPILKGIRLLLVDDHQGHREICRHQLNKWGIKVTEAHDGLTALDLCEQQVNSLFDFALIDQNMPHLNGKKLAQKLRADPRFNHLKLILMTSAIHPEKEEILKKIGYNSYLSKPISGLDLMNILSLLISAQKPDPFISIDQLHAHSPQQTVRANPWPANSKILMVEDNPINQIVTLKILEKIGLPCKIAENGNIALEMLKASVHEPYSLILMDCLMPELNGYDATEKIREGQAGAYYKSIPVIALTASVMQGDKEKCLNSGMNDYLSKPVEQSQIKSMIQKWLQPRAKTP